MTGAEETDGTEGALEDEVDAPGILGAEDFALPAKE
jgi:hypothetical protein